MVWLTFAKLHLIDLIFMHTYKSSAVATINGTTEPLCLLSKRPRIPSSRKQWCEWLKQEHSAARLRPIAKQRLPLWNKIPPPWNQHWSTECNDKQNWSPRVSNRWLVASWSPFPRVPAADIGTKWHLWIHNCLEYKLLCHFSIEERKRCRFWRQRLTFVSSPSRYNLSIFNLNVYKGSFKSALFQVKIVWIALP